MRKESRDLIRELVDTGWRERFTYPEDVTVLNTELTGDGVVVVRYTDDSFLVTNSFGGAR
jgi:hypothetical protein